MHIEESCCKTLYTAGYAQHAGYTYMHMHTSCSNCSSYIHARNIHACKQEMCQTADEKNENKTGKPQELERNDCYWSHVLLIMSSSIWLQHPSFVTELTKCWVCQSGQPTTQIFTVYCCAFTQKRNLCLQSLFKVSAGYICMYTPAMYHYVWYTAVVVASLDVYATHVSVSHVHSCICLAGFSAMILSRVSVLTSVLS